MAAVLKPESLAELLTFGLWTEPEFVDILCGVDPRSPRHLGVDSPTDDLDVRRASAQRHVDDAILRGDLRTEPRISDRRILEAIERHVEHAELLADIRRAVHATVMYEPRKVRPEVAVAWTLERRGLFGSCPLTPEDLDRAVQARAGVREPGDSQTTERLHKRALWLRELMKERGLTYADISRNKGPDRKTIKKILSDTPVSSQAIEKLANALSLPSAEVP